MPTKFAPVKANPVNALIPTCTSGHGVKRISSGAKEFRANAKRNILNDLARQNSDAPMLDKVAARLIEAASHAGPLSWFITKGAQIRPSRLLAEISITKKAEAEKIFWLGCCYRARASF